MHQTRILRNQLFGLFLFFLATSPAANAQDVTNGLVAHYTFCDCTARDISGNNFHATIVGDPQCTKGIRDNGLLLNQVPRTNDCGQPGSEYVRLQALGPIWQQGFTVCAWVRYDNIKNYERIIDFGNGTGEANGLNIWFGREGNSDHLTLESWINNDGNQARSTGRLVAQNAITNGKIEYYSATISGDEMRIYVDGVLKAQKRGNPIANITRYNNFIGRSNWCANDPDFKGFMDEVRIYNRALSQQEIQNLFQIRNITDFAVQTSCSNRQATFTAQNVAGVDSIRWSFGDPASGLANTASGANASHLFTGNGSYNVRLIAFKPCQNDTIFKTVTVQASSPDFLGPDFDLCPGKPAVLRTALAGSSYRWQNGSTADSLAISQPGTYWLQVRTSTCVYSDTVVVRSAQKTTTLAATICPGQTFLGYSTPGTFVDTFALANGCDSIRTLQLTVQPPARDSSSVTICQGQNYSGYTTAGIYRDTLRYTSGCDSLVRVIRLSVNRVLKQAKTVSICQGHSYVLPWGQSISAAGVYADTLRYRSGCDSLIRTVTVEETPRVMQIINARVCAGGRYTLPWGAVVSTAGIYRDTLRYSSGCDSLVKEVRLTVVAAAVQRANVSICAGDTYLLPWNQVVSVEGRYRDTVKSVLGCDSLVREISLEVKPRPVVTLSKSNDVDCRIGVARLIATGGTTYQWSPATSLNNAFIANPIASPAQSTSYRVQVTENGCTTEDSITVFVSFANAGQGFYVPSAFSPNGDGRNDCFGVAHWGAVENFHLQVFNRWGDRVFQSGSVNDCWDGTYRGKEQEPGVFVYLITADTNCGRVERKGTVTLVR